MFSQCAKIAAMGGIDLLTHAGSLVLSISDVNGMIDLLKLIFSPEIDMEKSHIPLHAPHAKDQRGPTCAIYSLEIALAEAYPDRKTPPARKHDEKPTMPQKIADQHKISLRKIAKKYGSVTGEIANLYWLKKTADELGFTECEVIKSEKNNYIASIKASIASDHYVLLPVDVDNGFPGNKQGSHLHCALAWGFICKNDKTYFLVTQWGKHYLWSADALQASHEQMPEANIFGYGRYYKDRVRDYYYPKVDNKEIPDKDLRFKPLQPLNNLKFTALAVPVAAAKKHFLVVKKTDDERSFYSAVKTGEDVSLQLLFKTNEEIIREKRKSPDCYPFSGMFHRREMDEVGANKMPKIAQDADSHVTSVSPRNA